jgi:PAS domain S-box-containing protein
MKTKEDRLPEQYDDRFRVVLNAVPTVAVQGYASDGTVLYWNKASERLYGYRAEEVLGLNLFDLIIPPELADAARGAVRRMCETSQPIPAGELLLLRKDGSRVPVYSSHSLVRLPGGGLEMFCIDIDLTEQKRNEAALRRRGRVLEAVGFAAEQFLRNPDWRGSIGQVLGRLGGAIEVSRAVLWEARSGEGAETFLSQLYEWAGEGMTLRNGDPSLRDLPVRAAGFQRWQEVLSRGGVIRGLVRDFPDAERRVLSHHRILSVLAVPVMVAERWWGFMAFDECARERIWEPEEVEVLQAAANILGGAVERQQTEAERKELEARLRQAQRMEAIGQLAGGVAHDFNNILASILLNINLVQQSPGLGGEARESLGELESDARRAADLTRQLLLFSRRSVLRVESVSINDIVRNLLKMLRRLIGEQITLDWREDRELPAVSGDAGLLEQVVMNLVVNARDAMPNGGRVTLGTRELEVGDGGVAGDAEARPGRFVVLSVADTGCGMESIMLKRIFEPFFTTKPAGQGTGLGLATVYGITRQHGGWVSVESQVGKGSTFRVHLPVSGASASGSAQGGPHRSSVSGHETVLLVEDDAAVRRTVLAFLRHAGYRVIDAVDGVEAMELWTEHQDEVQLLFTDMVMPRGLTGLQLAEILRTTRPDLRVLITSGYSPDLAKGCDLEAMRISFLPKPCTAQEISSAVRHCLDAVMA